MNCASDAVATVSPRSGVPGGGDAADTTSTRLREDIRFIARRLIICASEDVGMADSNALVVAVAAQQAVESVGLPEAQLVLAHATVYVATAAPRPLERHLPRCARVAHLRDTHYKAAKKLGHGEGNKYSHDYEGGYVPQAYVLFALALTIRSLGWKRSGLMHTPQDGKVTDASAPGRKAAAWRR